MKVRRKARRSSALSTVHTEPLQWLRSGDPFAIDTWLLFEREVYVLSFLEERKGMSSSQEQSSELRSRIAVVIRIFVCPASIF